MLNITLLSKIAGGLIITFVSANQRWGSFSTVGVRDIAYEKTGDKDVRRKMGIRHRRKKGKKVLSAYQKFIKAILFLAKRLSLVLDFSQYKYLSIKFLLLTQVAMATSWSKEWSFLENLEIPEVRYYKESFLPLKKTIHSRTTKLTFFSH